MEEKPKPSVQSPTDALVRVATAAVCSSDLHFYQGNIPGMTPGFIVGHKMIGVVEAVGRAVRQIKPGDRVVVSDFAVCGTCWYCRRLFTSRTSRMLFRYGDALGNLPHGLAIESEPRRGWFAPARCCIFEDHQPHP